LLTGKHLPPRGLSASHEHYLRAIWEVRSRKGYARLTDVARELAIAAPTLSVGVRPLEARGLVSHDENRFLVLTAAGEQVAREVHHRFSVLRAFLRDVLGIPETEAHPEADRMEHEVSPATAERLLDLVKLLRDDRELRDFFQLRFAEYHRQCRISEACAACDLGCVRAADGA
jgi:DtxR family Mn-dependent transcriptional regulator